MLTYQKYEKAVFDWLLKKHQSDKTFTFSLRQKASKGAENDYFIGTENSGYFATTFWSIPAPYAGASSDLINVRFKQDAKGFYYFYQFIIPRNDDSLPVQMALRFIKAIKPNISRTIQLSKESQESQKTEHFYTKPRKQIYPNIDEMMEDVFLDSQAMGPIIDDEIARIKKANPEFIGEKIQPEQFEKFLQKFERRKGKYSDTALTKPMEKPVETSKIEPKMNQIPTPLNQILYGPPGTGKTYNTINEAIKIIDPTFDLSDRKAVKKRFDELRAAGQIEFTTFHQSMNYEDFVEGIKPKEPEKNGDPISYWVEDGIFKRLATKSKYAFYQQILASEAVPFSRNDSFGILYEELVADFESQLSDGKSVEIPTKTGQLVKIVDISERQNIRVIHAGSESNKEYIVSRDRLFKLFQQFPDLDKIKNLDKEFRAVIGGSNASAYWAVLSRCNEILKNISKKGRIAQNDAIEILDYETIKSVVKDFKLTAEIVKANKPKPHVLIIDEINRGNVSQIFGELITLLETDKRLGNEESLEIMLPYSKETFAVPPNLYLIGTMNTADRSVEALDTALRRRFSFVEMPPKPELLTGIDGISLQDLLETINRRIEKLLDKDHLIGHSYFLKIDSRESLQDTFYRNIIPLLQEYFFGDFGKIGLVLGVGFFEKEDEKAENKHIFADFKRYEDVDDLEERPIFRLKNVTKMNADEFETALKTLLKK
jgi:5-methylcytosine-specific restriction enzyme B